MTLKHSFYIQIVLYVFFPVAIFLYFNFPGSYEEYMTQKKVCGINCYFAQLSVG